MTYPTWVRTHPSQTACRSNAGLYLRLSQEEEQPPQWPATEEGRRKAAKYTKTLAGLRRTARDLCEACPVFESCLHEAVTGLPVDGFVAGTTGRERRKLRRLLEIPAAAEPASATTSQPGRKVPTAALEAALSAMPEASSAEVAAVLGCSSSTVRRYRIRCRNENAAAAPRTAESVVGLPGPAPQDTVAAFELVIDDRIGSVA